MEGSEDDITTGKWSLPWESLRTRHVKSSARDGEEMLRSMAVNVPVAGCK